MKTKVLLSLAFMCASHVSLAQDASQSFTEATKVMDKCAEIAKKIAAIKPPTGHLEAREALRFNRTLISDHEKAFLAKTKAPAGTKAPEVDPAQLKKISPEHDAFLTNIRAQRKELQQCGEEYSKSNATTRALVKKTSDALGAKKTATDDDKKTGAALVAYMKSSENLSKEVTALSKDEALTGYFNRTIQKYFLGQNITIEEPTAPAATKPAATK